MTRSANSRLDNLLAALSLNLAHESQQALERASGLSGSGTAALLALEEFLGDEHVGRLAEVLGLTHSGAVRLVMALEREGLAERREGGDRRRVEVRLTRKGRARAARARAARDSLVASSTTGLTPAERRSLEPLLAKMTEARVRARLEQRRQGETGPWWCRTCDFTACGRDEGRCPARATTQG